MVRLVCVQSIPLGFAFCPYSDVVGCVRSIPLRPAPRSIRCDHSHAPFLLSCAVDPFAFVIGVVEFVGSFCVPSIPVCTGCDRVHSCYIPVVFVCQRSAHWLHSVHSRARCVSKGCITERPWHRSVRSAMRPGCRPGAFGPFQCQLVYVGFWFVRVRSCHSGTPLEWERTRTNPATPRAHVNGRTGMDRTHTNDTKGAWERTERCHGRSVMHPNDTQRGLVHSRAPCE